MEYYSAIFPTLTLLELNYRYCPHGNFLHLKIHCSIFLALCTAMPYTQQTLKRTEGGKHQKEKSCRKFSGGLMEVSPLSSCPQQNVSGARVEKSSHKHSIVLMGSHACSVAQSCPTLCNHGLWPARLLCHGISQARTLEKVAISFSRGSSQPWD